MGTILEISPFLAIDSVVNIDKYPFLAKSPEPPIPFIILLPIILPPNREAIPLTKVDDRIGTTYIPCNKEKIVGIVFTDIKDKTRPIDSIDETSKKMADNLIKFLENEVKENRLPKNCEFISVDSFINLFSFILPVCINLSCHERALDNT